MKASINRRHFYAALNTGAAANDELFALAIGKIYWGWYKSDGLYFGWLDNNDALHSFAELK